MRTLRALTYKENVRKRRGTIGRGTDRKGVRDGGLWRRKRRKETNRDELGDSITAHGVGDELDRDARGEEEVESLVNVELVLLEGHRARGNGETRIPEWSERELEDNDGIRMG